MTIETLNAIKAEATTLQTSIDVLNIRLSDYEFASGVQVPEEINTAWGALGTNLTVIVNWVNQAIEDGGNTGEIGVMQAMLAELKAVFDKYNAVIEYVSSGYGEDMGENYGGASFYRLTATDPVNGNVETKDIVSATLTSEQLV